MLTGNILMTGGAGYLGRGVLRAAQRSSWPCRFTVVSRDEQKQHQCSRQFPDLPVRYVLADIADTERLTALCYGHDAVIHMAAVKFIPEAEHNVEEAVRVNVGGTLSVLQAAVRAGVPRVVCVSTDKAVHPINTYGFTKAVVERLVGEYGQRRGTRVTGVRYGNVIGSTGSVIPLFKHQLQTQGHVSVTDPAMTRFWMPVDDAVALLLYALSDEATPGGIAIPLMRALSMGDLATLVARDRVCVVGPRPGEKQHEELIHEQESPWVRLSPTSPYWELRPVPQRQSDYTPRAPFTISSQHPPAGWVTPEDMLAWIKDAETL